MSTSLRTPEIMVARSSPTRCKLCVTWALASVTVVFIILPIYVALAYNLMYTIFLRKLHMAEKYDDVILVFLWSLMLLNVNWVHRVHAGILQAGYFSCVQRYFTERCHKEYIHCLLTRLYFPTECVAHPPFNIGSLRPELAIWHRQLGHHASYIFFGFNIVMGCQTCNRMHNPLHRLCCNYKLTQNESAN